MLVGYLEVLLITVFAHSAKTRASIELKPEERKPACRAFCITLWIRPRVLYD